MGIVLAFECALVKFQKSRIPDIAMLCCIVVGVFFVALSAFSNCAEENTMWTISALSTVVVNFVFVHSLIAGVKVIFF